MLSWLAKPEWLVLLAIVPLVGALAWRARNRRRQSLARLGDATFLQSQIVQPVRLQWRVAGWALVLTLLALAAAGPRWGAGPPPDTKPGCDAMLVVDVSRSMLARDALPDRLTRAKAALTDLVDAVQRRGGHRLGVVAVAGQAQVVCPLTHDYNHVRAKIAALSADPLPAALASTGVSGTRLGVGITTAIDAFDFSDRGAQMIVLVSDGDDPAGDEEWRAGISAARHAAIPVFAVGIGDANQDSPIPSGDGTLTFAGQPTTTRLHEEPLRTIAQRTGGEYMTAGTAKPELAEFVQRTMNQFPTRESVAGMLPQPAQRQLWFLLPAFVLLLMLLGLSFPIRGQRAAPALAAFVFLGAIIAPNDAARRGVAALDAGNAEKALAEFQSAAERTTDPGQVAFNEGVALYRLGRFREAELRFRWSLSDAEGQRRARANYNLGCALVQSSQGLRAESLRQAVAAFEQALGDERLDAELQEPARENLELTRQLLARLQNAVNADASAHETERQPQGKDGASDPATGDGKGADARVSDRARNKDTGGATPQQTDQQPMPGKGHLPPISDSAKLAPLSADDAKALLDQAAARITAARQAQLRTNATKPSSKFPDW